LQAVRAPWKATDMKRIMLPVLILWLPFRLPDTSGQRQEAEDMLDAAGLPYDWHLPSKPGGPVPRSALAGVVAPAEKCATPHSLPPDSCSRHY